MDGLGLSNSVFFQNSRNDFGLLLSSDGAKVKRFMMSACVLRELVQVGLDHCVPLF